MPSGILIAEPPFSIRQSLRRNRVPVLISLSAPSDFRRHAGLFQTSARGSAHTGRRRTWLPIRARLFAGPRASAEGRARSPQSSKDSQSMRQETPALPAPEIDTAKIAAPNTSSPVSATPDSSSGTDSLGSGDISIAVLKASPRPRPDLSQLPRGSAGDVVLDAVIGPDGSIEKLTLVRGLGHGIDEVVIATVQAWTFLPATKDGKPIASEQELHFHYERG